MPTFSLLPAGLVLAWTALHVVRLLAQRGPELIRAANERTVVRTALRARDRREWERACQVLEILRRSESPGRQPGTHPPGPAP